MKTSLSLFSEFIGRTRFVDVRVSHVLSFVDWLYSRRGIDGTPAATQTVKQRFNLMRKTYRVWEALELVSKNPFEMAYEIVSFRQDVQKRNYQFILPAMALKIVNKPPKNTPEGIRDRALLALFIGGGLRRSETNKLNVGHITVTPRGNLCVLLVATKAGKAQNQSLPAWAARRFSELVIQRKSEGAENDSPAFVNYSWDKYRFKRLSYETIGRIFKRYSAACGAKLSPHSARATAITVLKMQKRGDDSIQNFSRHASSRSVRIYQKRGIGPDENPALTGLTLEALSKLNQRLKRAR